MPIETKTNDYCILKQRFETQNLYIYTYRYKLSRSNIEFAYLYACVDKIFGVCCYYYSFGCITFSENNTEHFLP